MQKINFIFIAVSYLSIVLLAGFRDISVEAQAIIASVFVFGMGVPHGAVDHILHNGAENKFSPRFLMKYIGTMMLVLVAWLIVPAVSLSIFLVVSAYHFGEGQFSDLKLSQNNWTHLLNLSWGSTILLILFILNHNQLIGLFGTYTDTEALSVLFNIELLYGLLLLSALGIITSTYVIKVNQGISSERIAHEIYVLGLITFTFYVVPLLIAFTLFFCILHSLKVLGQEFEHLKETYADSGLRSFVTMLAPFTLISVGGAIAVVVLIFYELIPISILLFSLIAISMITLPHSVVMSNFYQRSMS